MKYSPQQEQELMADLWTPALADDVLRWVLYVFPWGKPNTPLQDMKMPRKWQCEDMDEISQHIRDNKLRIELGQTPQMFRKGTVSGRGPGKTAEIAMLIWWFISTRLGSTTIVTANGEPQLRSRTWPEIGKWATLALNSHWFDYQATSLRPVSWFSEAIKRDLSIDTGYYYAQAQLWREEAPDAFAGAHNPLGMFLLCDEASGVPPNIFSVSEGFFTEKSENRFWLCFSNGRRNSGPFFDIFHPKDPAKDPWRKRQLDSRTVEGIDHKIYQDIIDKYGPDSDEARVEVYGQFPNQSDRQFIASDRVREAQQREKTVDKGEPLVMGVDLSRGRKDQSVIRFRRGRDARTIPPRKCMETDSVKLAEWVQRAIEEEKPDGICIDGGDLGRAICDILKRFGYTVHEVGFGMVDGIREKELWADNATQMWADMRDWLRVGAIDTDPKLAADLTQREKRTVGRNMDKTRLESKDELRDRGCDSPDDADALALTFGKKFARRDTPVSRRRGDLAGRVARDVDYSLFGR
jgi:hypothetical protein